MGYLLREATNFSQEVMYLAIVNMPTDDEMRAAQNALGHANY
jgi:hypothetical protein